MLSAAIPYRSPAGRVAGLLALLLMTVPWLSRPATAQERELSPPVRVTVDAPAGTIAPGAATTIEGEIRLDADAPLLTLRFETEGPVDLLGAASRTLGAGADGQVFTYSIPVEYRSEGEAAVHVWAEASAPDGTLLFSERQTLYALIRPGSTLTGRGGFQPLRIQAIRDDLAAGAITQDQADAADAEQRRVPAVHTQTPIRFRAFSGQEQTLNQLVGLSPQGAEPAPAQDLAPGANITVQGNVQWTDQNGATHAVFGAKVDIRDDDLVVDENITTVYTDASGNYSAAVDDNDGIGQGDRDIYVRVSTENGWVKCRPTGLSGPYAMDSPVHDETPGGSTIVENFTAPNNGNGDAFSVFQAGTWIGAYVEMVNGSAMPQVGLVWPNGDDHSFYNGSTVRIEQPDRWDWDTVHHEYGHYVMDQLNIENNPGGNHNLGDCIADVHNNKSEGVRLAWGEGWPTYNGTVAQAELNLAALGVPRVGDTTYQDVEDGSVVYSLETDNNTGRGEDNEVAVQRLLWDLYDQNDDGRDLIFRSDVSIWNAIKNAHPTTLSGAWTALRAGQPNLAQIRMGEIAADQQIGPIPLSPPDHGTVSPTSADFSWNGAVGCPSSYSGDSFDLVFYDPVTRAKVLTVPGLSSPSHTLTNTEIQTLLASGHQMLWAVEGSNSQSPATGPYLGENFAVTVNTPPVADAGPDQPNVECASHTTTAVQLDGTGSSDPDGDPLTYTWTASGVVFDNNHSATPTGQFPEGTTTVTLTVSDGLEEDTDTVDITVVDTTPPSVTCPGDITQECTGGCGVPANADSLVAWFAEFSASDVCDDNLTIVNDAPACFPLGTTVVTWTATDDANNQAQCSASVTVEDTTPPEIAVELNRDCLWPPNHKMSPISADVTVTDVCDPNPSFVLYDITSSEPDDGKGDGHTTGDIQEADYGTEDVDFLLRSERRGGGDGRIYTIIYRAMDGSGNAAYDTVTVTVPHDQGGGAICATGFAADGASFASGAASYVLVVPSTSDLRAGDILPLSADLGNHVGVVAPSNHALADVTGDGLDDLVLLYDAPAVGDLYAASTGLSTGFDGSTDRIGEKSDRGYVVGLHFRTADGGNYLVGNILSLGEPVTLSAFLPWGGGGGQLLDPGAADEEPGRDRQEDPGRPMLVLPSGGPVLVEVYNVLGQKVSTLINADLPAGAHPLAWDGRDATGRRVSSGMYFYRIQAPQRNEVRKIFLVR